MSGNVYAEFAIVFFAWTNSLEEPPKLLKEKEGRRNEKICQVAESRIKP